VSSGRVTPPARDGGAEPESARRPTVRAGSSGGSGAPGSEDELEEALSRPTAEVVEALQASPGDVVILGAGGKMGPSLARMARRAADAIGDGRRVIAVSRFSDPGLPRVLNADRVETIRADLLDQHAVDALPDASNVVFMAGQKFGTRSDPATTWAMNVLVPAAAAERYAGARIVAFSTGNVYPLVPASGPGSSESDAPEPVGEYAQSCLGRERVLEHVCGRTGSPLAIVRLNYANALRYGVLTDLALAVRDGQPIDLTMGWVNVIWQGDANALALRCFAHATRPPFIVNVAGCEHLRVRDAALALGERLGRAPVFTGAQAPDALLSDASRARAFFGPPRVSTHELIDWTARWIAAGGATLGKATMFQARDGGF
jgi:nucleoside-diphosphate-sugar epimerase